MGPVFVSALEFALNERTQPLLKDVHRLADALMIGNGHALLLIEQLGLGWLRLAAVARQARNFRPALHEAVVRKSLRRALLTLAHHVEPIGQLAGDLGFATEL